MPSSPSFARIRSGGPSPSRSAPSRIIKTLISYNYYDEESFWRIFNKANYDVVKARTDPDNVFRDLYTKTVLAPRGLVEAHCESATPP